MYKQDEKNVTHSVIVFVENQFSWTSANVGVSLGIS